MGDRSPAGLRARASIRGATARRVSTVSSIAGSRAADLVALLWCCGRCSTAPARSRLLRRGPRRPGGDRHRAPRSTASRRRALALDLRAAYGRVPARPGRLLLLPAPVERQRLQAAEPVPALDGAPRRARSRRLDARAAGAARRSARHPRHPGRPLPAPDALHQSGLADGAGHHGVAPAARPRGSGQVRLLDVPPGDDERLRVRAPAG